MTPQAIDALAIAADEGLPDVVTADVRAGDAEIHLCSDALRPDAAACRPSPNGARP